MERYRFFFNEVEVYFIYRFFFFVCDILLNIKIYKFNDCFNNSYESFYIVVVLWKYVYVEVIIEE